MVLTCGAHVLSQYLRHGIKTLDFNVNHFQWTCIYDHSILELKPAVISRIKA